MAQTRKHIAFSEAHISVLRALSRKWGLDFSNTVRHCVMRIAEQEGVTPGNHRLNGPRKSAASG